MIGDIVRGLLYPNVEIETSTSDYGGDGVAEVIVKIVGAGHSIGVVLRNKAVRGYMVGQCYDLRRQIGAVTIRAFEFTAWGAEHERRTGADDDIPF